jgi:hypothetical protein
MIRVIDRIQYSRERAIDNKRTHVWIVDVDRPEARQLTSERLRSRGEF